MVSRKRTFEEDDVVDGVHLPSLAGRKIVKTEARAIEFAELNARADAATMAPVTITAKVEQLAPTAPLGRIVSAPAPTPFPASVPASVPAPVIASASASAPLSKSQGPSEDENEEPSMVSNFLRKDKGKGPASRNPSDTAADHYEKDLWRREWEKEIREDFLTEMMDAARSELESRWKSEKLQWEEEAIVKVDEQIEAMRQWFQQQTDKAHEAAQDANAHAETQIERCNRIWTDLQTKQEEVNFLQARLNEANTSLAEGLAMDEQDNATAILKQKDLEIEKLVAESTRAKSELDISNKARHDAVEEAANHVKEIKDLEERLGVVRGVNKDLYSAGAEMTKKIYQLETAIEEAQSLSQASQNLAKEPNETDGESQALPRDPNATNKSNVDEQALKGTMPTPSQNEDLVDALKRKVAKLTNDSDAELKKLKLEMAAGLKEAMEGKEKVVRKLKMVEDSEELMNGENQTLKRRHKEMARKASKDATDIASLFSQVKVLRSAKQKLLEENGLLRLHVNSFKSKLLVETELVDDANSQITKLNGKICDQDFRLSNTVRAHNSEIKALKKAVREAESTIFTLRQWDAESGVTERDELIKKRDQTIKKRDLKIQQLEKAEKRCMDHIRKLEKEIFKRNIGLFEKVSRWIFGGEPLP